MLYVAKMGDGTHQIVSMAPETEPLAELQRLGAVAWALIGLPEENPLAWSYGGAFEVADGQDGPVARLNMEKAKAIRAAEIVAECDAKLAELDAKSARALRDAALGDTTRVAALESQAETLRFYRANPFPAGKEFANLNELASYDYKGW